MACIPRYTAIRHGEKREGHDIRSKWYKLREGGVKVKRGEEKNQKRRRKKDKILAFTLDVDSHPSGSEHFNERNLQTTSRHGLKEGTLPSWDWASKVLDLSCRMTVDHP